MRTCRICKAKYEPRRSIQPTCDSYACNYAYAAKVAQKSIQRRIAAERKEVRAQKERLKTRSDYLKEAQIAFNRYIRLRDYGKTCVCCDKDMDWTGNKVDCGHYRSVGSAPFHRFNEDNAHAQDKQCNRYGSGRAVDYRIGLIARIGLARVEALESDNNPKKYTIDDLKAIRDEYRRKLREIQALSRLQNEALQTDKGIQTDIPETDDLHASGNPVQEVA